MKFARPFFSPRLSAYLYISFFFISLPQTTLAGASVTLKQAVMTALDNNRSLSASEMRTEAAREKAAEATGRLLPRLDASYSASRTDSPINVFGNKLLQKRFTAADFAITTLNNPDTINNYHTDLSITVPVYQGGALWAGKRMGEAGAEAAEWRYQANRQTTIFRVIEAFTLLKQTEAQRDAAAQALRSARKHLDNTIALKRRGIAISSDVMDAKAHQLQASVRLCSAANIVDSARDQLQLLLAMPPDQSFDAAGEPALALSSRNMHAWIRMALAKHPVLESAKHRLKAALARVDQARAPFRPVVNLQATEEWNSNTVAPRNINTTIAAEVRFNFFSGGADQARLQAAEAETSARKLALAELRQRIRNEVLAAWRALDESEKRLNADTQVLQHSLESLRIRRLREQQGLERASDVLDAQTRADQARSEAIRSRYSLVLARARLLTAAGMLKPEVIQ